jgi:TPR repeat protein
MEMKIGEWKVIKVDNHTVHAKPVDMYIPPAVGMTSKIETSPKKDGHEETVRQDQHNAYSILEDDKDTSVNSQYYVDKAKKMADDLYKNSKKYSKEKRKTLWNEVIKNIQIAISMNNAEAYYVLALIYEDGYGDIERDIGKMVHNIRISADRGYAEAQYTLGEMYMSGDEVVKDKEQAVLWLKKAIRQGHKEAKKELERLEHKKIQKQPSVKNNVNDLYDLLD